MRRRLACLVLVALWSWAGGASPAHAEDAACLHRCQARWNPKWRIEFEGAAVWQSRNDVAIPGDTGTRFDLTDLTGKGPFPGGRVTLDWQFAPRHRLRAMVAPLEFSGTGRLDRPVRFAGRRYAAGIPTEATYRFNSYRLGYHYTLLQSRRWTVRVGAAAKIRDAKIELSQGAKTSRDTDLGFVPLLHADATYRISPRWWATADVDGLGAPQGRAIDLALKLHFRLDHRCDLAVGYRTIEGGADNDSVYTFAWLHQAVVSIGVRF
jgi:hypothetical protein